MVESVRLPGDRRGWVGKVEMQEDKIVILPSFRSFLELPLYKPILANLIFNCPVGVAITDQRIWIVHLPMISLEQEERLVWPDWSSVESGRPRGVFVFGNHIDRLINLNIILQDKTKTLITSLTLPLPRFDRFSEAQLRIEQNSTQIKLVFYEADNLQNQCVATFV